LEAHWFFFAVILTKFEGSEPFLRLKELKHLYPKRLFTIRDHHRMTEDSNQQNSVTAYLRLLGRFRDCEHSSLAYFRKGLIATVILGKCCEVTSRILPRPFEDFIE
jgi:hypothetical protein